MISIKCTLEWRSNQCVLVHGDEMFGFEPHPEAASPKENVANLRNLKVFLLARYKAVVDEELAKAADNA